VKTIIKMGEVGEKNAAEDVGRALIVGGLAITPTDTVYGLAVLVYEPGKPCREVWRKPYDKLAAVKGRTGPYIILLPYWDAASAFTEDDTTRAAAFAEAYGRPVTFLFNPRPRLDELLAGPEGKVALRVVGHGFIGEVTSRVGPIFSSSANYAEGNSPRFLNDVESTIRDAADVEVDGGPSTEGPSAVVDATTERFAVVRPAPGLEEALREFGSN
jgi:tRNA A37 threonylcarbamoyladenosine synthetase subunit TsaC/SUA5/YrdC